MWLIGHVTLSDGQNVTKGDKLTYDLKSGQATVDTSAKSGRVHGQFVPKSSTDATNRAPTPQRRMLRNPNRSPSVAIFRARLMRSDRS